MAPFRSIVTFPSRRPRPPGVQPFRGATLERHPAVLYPLSTCNLSVPFSSHRMIYVALSFHFCLIIHSISISITSHFRPIHSTVAGGRASGSVSLLHFRLITVSFTSHLRVIPMRNVSLPSQSVSVRFIFVSFSSQLRGQVRWNETEMLRLRAGMKRSHPGRSVRGGKRSVGVRLA